jgi:hypothetical protein
MLQITEEAAATLDSQYVVREIDRAGHPHLLIKVPDLQKSPEADIGLEIRREGDGCIVISVLLYDIPTEPVSYEMRFFPSQPGDLKFLLAFIDAAQFRLHPCARIDGEWEVAKSQTFRVPANVLLRLKHFSMEWPDRSTVLAAASAAAPAPSKILGDLSAQPPPPPTRELFIDPTEPELEPFDPATAEPVETKEEDHASDMPLPRRTQADPRDMVIQKLKQQNQTLRAQLREKDKRIIEIEDELNEIKSRGRGYRLSNEKKSWWKPF